MTVMMAKSSQTVAQSPDNANLLWTKPRHDCIVSLAISHAQLLVFRRIHTRRSWPANLLLTSLQMPPPNIPFQSVSCLSERQFEELSCEPLFPVRFRYAQIDEGRSGQRRWGLVSSRNVKREARTRKYLARCALLCLQARCIFQIAYKM